MLHSLLTRYWATAIGLTTVSAVVGMGVFWLAGTTVGSLVEANMKAKGAEFGALLEQHDADLQLLLTGISRGGEEEGVIRKVASLSGIGSFSIYNAAGAEVFSTSSDRYSWLLRDRPGGMQLGKQISEHALSQPGAWQTVSDDGVSDPSVVVPLNKGERRVGYASITADMSAIRRDFRRTLASASLKLLGILGIACGLPVLIYVRRRRKIAEADERIEFLATRDTLTHLLNRLAMQEETDKLLGTMRATREQAAYIHIDVDGLSETNASLGHAAGDDLLRTVARRLQSLARRGDLLARIGPDDFAFLRRQVDGEPDATKLAKRIHEALGEPLTLAGKIVRPEVSIGCAFAPADGRTHTVLTKHAELAHRHHRERKEKGEPLVFFESWMDEELHRQREVEWLVKDALANERFQLFFQPIVCGRDESLLGFEALIRLRDPNGDHIPPSVFIPLAERRGLIKAIGTWVIREAVRQISLWPEHLFVAVNLSAVQFEDGDIVEIVRSALAENAVPGRRLELEIVESLVLERNEAILHQLQDLKALGVSIDMDDFGTGYSSLGYFWRFPFDKVKIDQSFMAALDAGESNVAQVISTIVSMAHSLKMKVTSEGVESVEQARFLRKIGCDQLQGYHFGRPMPAIDIERHVLPTAAAAMLRTALPAPVETAAAEQLAG